MKRILLAVSLVTAVSIGCESSDTTPPQTSPANAGQPQGAKPETELKEEPAPFVPGQRGTIDGIGRANREAAFGSGNE